MQPDDNDRLAPRGTVLLQARCRKSSWHVFPVELGDLSQGGCSIVGSGESFAVGEVVRLTFANLKPIEAQVRWVVEGTAGVEFRAALKARVIDELSAVYGISG
ncbi:PilZ domain-containing protein [Novosphingobium resinovorum]|uniref:PilZ domain-containing protein n=1 Tax=Novosphingobium resinovorum TaxID=158500 RepID=UPI002ED4A044|nr:PilZ domain-containing protein [Novosphingobium resinovorum]